MSKPKILLLDLETSPILGHVWSLWENNVALNQIQEDWHILSWSAKFLDAKEIMYEDQRNSKNLNDERKLLKQIWYLLDQSDIVVGHNSKKFDIKKLNAKFIEYGMQPPSSFKQIDTLDIAKKHFAFSSNKLEYLCKKLDTKHKKLNHKKFPGHELWVECLKGNMEAWKEMEKYNKHDVLALEDVYKKLLPWNSSINFSTYSDQTVCSCGSTDFTRNGFCYTSTGKYQRFSCRKCGAEVRNRQSLLSKDKKSSLKVPVNR